MYIDLMGPFEEDLQGTVYDMTVMDGDTGWLEVTGIRDKSSETTEGQLKEVLNRLSNRTNTRVEDFSRAHTDQGGEFKGVFDEANEYHTHRHWGV